MPSKDKRKLAAIMFADVVGYSRMMASNEERTLELLKDFENICSPIISKHDGEIIKKVGDELFCEFSSAKQAVDSALAIQEAIQPYNDSRPKDFKLQVRIGIHVGDIVLRDGDVFGDGVNVASRIQPFANPGGICVSNAVKEVIASHPSYNIISEGQQELKNIVEKHTLYRVETGYETVDKNNNPPTQSLIKKQTNVNIYTITGMILTCLGIGFWFFFSTSSLSTANENIIENSIAVFGFKNLSSTDDIANIGEILQHLIISDLSGLTHLKVISHQRLKDIQKQNSKDEENYSIAQQANAKVFLSGSLMDLSGKKIMLGELIDAIDGNVIKSHRIEGNNIYSMVDEITELIRQDLDISNHEDDHLAIDAGSKTTQSLDAYNNYLEGVKYLNELNYKLADEKFQEAIRIDSTFFDAYYLSGISRWWLNEGSWEENITIADNIRRGIKSVTFYDKNQKLKAAGAYHLFTVSYDSARYYYEQLVEIDSNDKVSWYALGEAYFHMNKNEAQAKELYEKANISFQRALELDPNFRVARIHIFHILLMEGKFVEIIEEEKENLERDNLINITNKSFLKESFENIIISYDLLEDSVNSIKYLDQAKASLNNNQYCQIINHIGFTLGFNFGLAMFSSDLSMTNYHKRKSIYYLQDVLKICDDSIIHPEGKAGLLDVDAALVVLSNVVYGSEYAQKIYDEQIENMPDIEHEAKFSYKISSIAAYPFYNKKQYAETDRDMDCILEYAYKTLKYSIEYNDSEYFTKSFALILKTLKNINNEEVATSFFEEQLTVFCGSENIDNTLSCLNSFDGLVKLAKTFIELGNYYYATIFYQYLIDQVSLVRDVKVNEEEILSHLHEAYYGIGIMNLRTHNYFTARQNFLSAEIALNENENKIKLSNPSSHVTSTLLKNKIAECYYNEDNLINAIKYYKDAYNSTTIPNEKIIQLYMLAISEYYNNQIDTSKVHFNQVIKYYEKYFIKDRYNIAWVLYQYFQSEGNTIKAHQYLIDAYNNIPEDKREQYLQDENYHNHIYKYYDIHEIIQAYNQIVQ